MCLVILLSKGLYMDFWFWFIFLTVISFFIELLRNDPNPWSDTPWFVKVILRTIGNAFWIAFILVIIKGAMLIINA